MISLIRAALFTLLFTLVVSISVGQEAPFEPFTDETFGIQGVLPEGWTKIQPGLYRRGGTSTTDVTILALQAAPGAADQVLQALLPSLGLETEPEPLETLETEAFNWTIYQIDVDAGGIAVRVALALTEQDGRTYLALLQTAPDEFEMLRETVFLPVLEAYAPLTESAATDEAAEPLPYTEEAISFENGEVTLAGTLTLPEGDGQHPAVVLISGSGPQDRDESLMPLAEMKPFQLIADALTRSGIAVLRYDDRGVGGSTGDYITATLDDFAADANAAVEYLLTREDINGEQVGILGHSEGGSIAPMIAANNEHVAFVIGMAGTAVNGIDTLLQQNRRILQVADIDEATIINRLDLLDAWFDTIINDDPASTDDDAVVREAFVALVEDQISVLSEAERATFGDIETYIDQQLPVYLGGYWRSILSYDPGEYWAQVQVPVLAMYGGLDVQVDAPQHSTAVEAALETAGNTDVTIITLPNANHLFQEAKTGGIEEYAILEQNFTPDFLPTIINWLLERVEVVGE